MGQSQGTKNSGYNVKYASVYVGSNIKTEPIIALLKVMQAIIMNSMMTDFNYNVDKDR